jgi:hypothetical protein
MRHRGAAGGIHHEIALASAPRMRETVPMSSGRGSAPLRATNGPFKGGRDSIVQVTVAPTAAAYRATVDIRVSAPDSKRAT